MGVEREPAPAGKPPSRPEPYVYASGTVEPLAVHRPGTTDRATLSYLMRHAGNRAVGTYLQRQPPAPAGGVSAPAPPVPAAEPTAAESAPVVLPAQGDLRVVFSSGRQMAFEANDLSEFGFGEGKLETPPIPVGEFISVSAAIGSHNPITLTKPTLTLDPVIGSISATEISRYRADAAGSNGVRTTMGAVAAGIGGIAGGLTGLVTGGALGAGAGSLLGPLGAAVGGVSGGLLGAKYGAEQGGLLAGGVSDSIYDFFHGDFDVTCVLDQGRISGAMGLHYTPFVRLSLSATEFEWLARISAELQTALDLTATASVALSGSKVALHFRDGTLQRTVFTLEPSAALDLDFTAEARLKLAGSLLNILEESTGRDEAVLSGEYTTQPFHLFALHAGIGAGTSFTFAKGSPMDILGKHIRAADGAMRERFTDGLRLGASNIPLLKKRGALDEKSRTGTSRDDAILMAWHKPPQWYPDYLTRPSAGGRGERISKFPHQVYDNGLAMGVDQWPYEGMKLQYRGGDEPRGGGVARFMRELKEEGIELDSDLAYTADIDHVVDWAFGGADDETNLWPLESGRNRSAGTTQNRFQKVWWAPDRGGQPAQTRIEEVPTGRWFEIAAIRDPDGQHG